MYFNHNKGLIWESAPINNRLRGDVISASPDGAVIMFITLCDR